MKRRSVDNREKKKEKELALNYNFYRRITRGSGGNRTKAKNYTSISRRSYSINIKALPKRNAHVLPEICIICGRDASWLSLDKVWTVWSF